MILVSVLLLASIGAGCRQEPAEPSTVDRRITVVAKETGFPIDGGMVAQLDEPLPDRWRGKELELHRGTLQLFTEARGSSEAVPNRVFLAANGRDIRFRPDVPLYPDEVYEGIIRISQALGDDGTARLKSRGGSTPIEFTTSKEVVSSVAIVPARIHARPPEDAVIEIVGLKGAIPRAKGGRAYSVQAFVHGHDTTLRSEVTTVQSDGSFELRVGRPEGRFINHYQREAFSYTGYDDIVVISVIAPDGLEKARARLLFWAEEDGRTFVVRRRQAASIETTEGFLIDIPAKVIETPWRVGLWRAEPERPLHGLPPGLGLAGSFRFELKQVLYDENRPILARDRAAANYLERTLRISVPAPEDAKPGALVVMVVPTVSPRFGKGLAPMGIGGVILRNRRRYLSNSAAVQPDIDGQTCAEVLKNANGPCLVADSLAEFRHTTDAVFLYERDTDWVLLAARNWRPQSAGLVGGSSDLDLEYVGQKCRSCRSFLLPAPVGFEGVLESVDRSAGWLIDSWDIAVDSDADRILMVDRRPETRHRHERIAEKITERAAKKALEDDARQAKESAEAERWSREALARFEASKLGYLKDSRTGLEWASPDNGSDIDWEEASRYCEDLTRDSRADWRLPSIDQLEGIFWEAHSDPCVRNAICHPPPGIDLTGIYAWSRTIKSDSKAWMFDFVRGSSLNIGRHLDSDSRALCVRRSDS